VVKKIATNNNFNIKKLLIPVAYAGLISGMMTLISTAPNLIVSEELSKQGYEPFHLLDFTPIGISMLILAIAYFIARNYFNKGDKVATVNLGSERMRALLQEYRIEGEIFRLQLTKDSEYVNRKVYETDIRHQYSLNILGMEVTEGFTNAMTLIGKDTLLRENHILYVQGHPDNVKKVCQEKNLKLLEYLGVHSGMLKQQIGLAELVIPFNSSFIDQSIATVGYDKLKQFNILGSKRLKAFSQDNLKNHLIKTGESLLLLGSRTDIAKLNKNTDDYIVFNIPFEQAEEFNTNKAITSISISLLMIILLVINLIPPVLTVLIAALLMIGTRCLTMEEAYKSINWSTVILIAAMLPFAEALEKTGGIQLIAENVMSVFGNGSPYLLVSGLFVVTVVLGSFLSNTATAVILAPIAIKIAEVSHISPYPIAMTIAIAASTAFLTPVASPVNMLVVAPGGYKFMDFVRIGFPMFVIALAVSLLLIPLLFPF
jgi:di/tricarboxylate transporter